MESKVDINAAEIGFHAEGSRRLVIALRGRALVGVDEPLRFVVSLENDMGHELGHAPLRDLWLRAADEGGEMPIEVVGARPGQPHAVRVGRPSVGAARLRVEPAEDGPLAGALGCASAPFGVVGADAAPAAGARAAQAAGGRGASERVIKLGGALRGRPLRLLESRDGVYAQLWDAGLGLARYLAEAAPAEWLGAGCGWRPPAPGEGAADRPLAGLRVLELGAGTGVTALALGALGASVAATDAAAGAVDLLRANARANGLGEAVRAAELAWGEDGPLLREPFSVVLGADLVYIEEAFAPLVGTLRAAVRRGAIGLLAYRRRCEPGAEAHFFHLLRGALRVERLAHARVGLGVALYRLTSRQDVGEGARGPAEVCQYCEYLKAQWARTFVEAHAPAAGGDGSGWSPADLLL